jgi:hypothetical protein
MYHVQYTPLAHRKPPSRFSVGRWSGTYPSTDSLFPFSDPVHARVRERTGRDVPFSFGLSASALGPARSSWIALGTHKLSSKQSDYSCCQGKENNQCWDTREAARPFLLVHTQPRAPLHGSVRTHPSSARARHPRPSPALGRAHARERQGGSWLAWRFRTRARRRQTRTAGDQPLLQCAACSSAPTGSNKVGKKI